MNEINLFFLLSIIFIVFLAGCTQQASEKQEGLVISKFSPDFSEVGSGSQVGIMLLAKNVGEQEATEIKVDLGGVPFEVKQESFQPENLLGEDTEFGFKGEEGSVEWLIEVPRKDVTQTYTFLADIYYGYTTYSIVFIKAVNFDYFKSLSESQRAALETGIQSVKTTAGTLVVSVALDQKLITTTDVPIVFEITNMGSGKVFQSGKTPLEETIDTILVEIKSENIRCPSQEVDKESGKFKVRLVQGKTGRLLCRLSTTDVELVENLIIELKATYRYFIEGKTTLKVLKTPYELPFSDISTSGSINLDSYDGSNVQGKLTVRVRNRGTTPMENVNAEAYWKLPTEGSFTKLSGCTKNFGNMEKLDKSTFECDINLPVKENNKINIKIVSTSSSKDDKPENNEAVIDKSFVYDAIFSKDIKPIVKSVEGSTVNFEIPVYITNVGNVGAKQIEVWVTPECGHVIDIPVNKEVTVSCFMTQSTTDKNKFTASIKSLPAETDKNNNLKEYTVSYQDSTPPIVGQLQVDFLDPTFLAVDGIFWFKKAVSIRADVSDVESGIEKCEYTVDNGATWLEAEYDSNYKVCRKDNLSDIGKDITANIRATNTAGLSSVGTSRPFKYDATPPTIMTIAFTTTLGVKQAYTQNTWTNKNIEVSNLRCQDTGGSGCTQTPVKYCFDTTNTCTPSTDFTDTIRFVTEETFVTDIVIKEGATYLRSATEDNLENSKVESFIIKIDKMKPATTVSSPVSGQSYYKNAVETDKTYPVGFNGKVSDNTGGGGINVDSTKFFIRRSSDSKYWTSSAWSSTQTWLPTKHIATDDIQVGWTSSANPPSTGDVGEYTTRSQATDRAGNVAESDVVTFSIIARP